MSGWLLLANAWLRSRRQRQNDWSKELEKGFSAVSSSGMARNPSRSREGSRPTSAYSEGPDRRDLSSHDSRSYDRLGIHDIAGMAGLLTSAAMDIQGHSKVVRAGRGALDNMPPNMGHTFCA